MAAKNNNIIILGKKSRRNGPSPATFHYSPATCTSNFFDNPEYYYQSIFKCINFYLKHCIFVRVCCCCTTVAYLEDSGARPFFKIRILATRLYKYFVSELKNFFRPLISINV